MADAMRYFVLLLLLISLLPSQEVKHAPTVEQCRADQRLWQDKLQTSDHSTLPDYMTLDKWFSEMAECRTLDPENVRQYYHTLGDLGFDQASRLEHFVDRHGLFDKFLEEDKAGKI